MTIAPVPPSSLRDDVADLCARATHLAARVRSGDARELPGATQALLVTELVHAAGLIDAAGASLLRAADVSGALRTAGFLTQKSFLTECVGLGGPHAGALVALGRSLDRYPVLRDSVLDGRVNVDAARVAAEGIDSAVTDLRGTARDEARAKGEAIMVPLAELGTVAQVETAAAGLVFHLDPQTAARRAMEAYERTEVRIGRVGTQAVVHMVLDAVTGAAFQTLLDAKVEAIYRSGSLPEELRPTGDEAEDERRRILARPRLYADIFAELVRELLDRGYAGRRHGQAPHVTLVVTDDVHAAGGPAQLLVPGQDPVLIPAELAELVLCDADLTEVHALGTRPDRPSLGSLRSMRRADLAPRRAASGLDHALGGRCAHVHCVGRRHRTATRTQRTALLVRDAHCRFPGCKVDPTRCEAHHVVEWKHRGATCLSNLVLLCRRHHALVHQGGWSIQAEAGLDPGDPCYWRFLPPDSGTVGVDGALLAERLRRGLPPDG